MFEVYGDYWDLSKKSSIKYLVCTVNRDIKNNGRLVMGAGIAKQFRDKYKNLDLLWGDQTVRNSRLLLIQHFNEKTLIGIPTKYHWKEKSSCFLIEQSLKELDIFLRSQSNKEKILMTRPGCGLGGLKWDKVKEIMEKTLSDSVKERVLIVHNE